MNEREQAKVVRNLAEDSPVTGNRSDVLAKFYIIPSNLHGILTLDIAAGESDFSSWLRSQGASAYSLDYLYNNLPELRTARTRAFLKYIESLTGQKPNVNISELFKDTNTLSFVEDFKTNPEYYISSSATKIPFPESHFDMIFSSYGILGVLDKNFELLINSVLEAVRVVRPEGLIQMGPMIESGGYLTNQQIENQKKLMSYLERQNGIHGGALIRSFDILQTGLLFIKKN
jgi:hypothetical protein